MSYPVSLGAELRHHSIDTMVVFNLKIKFKKSTQVSLSSFLCWLLSSFLWRMIRGSIFMTYDTHSKLSPFCQEVFFYPLLFFLKEYLEKFRRIIPRSPREENIWPPAPLPSKTFSRGIPVFPQDFPFTLIQRSQIFIKSFINNKRNSRFEFEIILAQYWLSW